MAWVWEHGPEKSTEKLVLLALADNANDAGECWPSISTIARKCSLSERSVIRAIGSLEKASYIMRRRRQDTSNLYRINFVGDKLSPTISDRESHTGVTESHQGGDRESLKPSFNHQVNHNIRGEDSNFSPSDFDEMQALLETMIGLPATNYQDAEAIRECVKLGVTSEDIAGALAWRKENGRGPVKTISQLLPGIKTNRSKRVQETNAKKPQPHRSQQPQVPVEELKRRLREGKQKG